MKTRALLLVLLLLALVACKVDSPTVQIQALCSPTDDCTFQDTCDMQIIGDPIVDVATATSFTVLLQVANQAADTADADAGRVNTRDAHVEEAIVGGIAMPVSSMWVPAQGTAVVAVTLPPIGGRINLQLRGHFDDGEVFKTGEFRLFVQTCSDCVSGCPTGQFACPGPGQAPFTCVDPSFDPSVAGTP